MTVGQICPNCDIHEKPGTPATTGRPRQPARGKGGHCLARLAGRKAPVPMHGDTDIGPIFIKMLCKQLGIDPKDL